LWALQWAWHIFETNLRCVQGYGIESQFSIFDSFRDINVHIYDFLKFVGGLWALKWAWHIAETNLRMDRQTDRRSDGHG